MRSGHSCFTLRLCLFKQRQCVRAREHVFLYECVCVSVCVEDCASGVCSCSGAGKWSNSNSVGRVNGTHNNKYVQFAYKQTNKQHRQIDIHTHTHNRALGNLNCSVYLFI